MGFYSNKIFLLLIISINAVISTIIKIPFKIIKYQKSNDQLLEKKVEDMSFNYKILSLIEIGNPPQKIEAIFNLKLSNIYISNNCINCTTFYSYESSISFLKIKTDKKPIGFGNQFYAYENLYLYDGINSRKKTANILIYLPELTKDDLKNKNIKNCLNIGLKFPDNTNDFQKTFIQQLKDKNIINQYFWTMTFYDNKYNKDYDGAFIFGNIINDYYPNIYNDQYSSNKLVHTYTGNIKKKNNSNKNNILEWGIQFNEIYYEINSNINDNINNIVYIHNSITEFDFNMNVILGTYQYFRSIEKDFFNFYLNKNICKTTFMRGSMYKLIYCNTENFTQKDLVKFPPLKFKNKILRYIFTLDYHDLFSLTDDKKYYIFNIMIVNVYHGDNNDDYGEWILGLPFLKKYQFSFDTDNKLIYFYNKDGNFLDEVPDDDDDEDDYDDTNEMSDDNKKINEENENYGNDTEINNNKEIISKDKENKKYYNIKIDKIILFIILLIIFIFLFSLLLLLVKKILFKKGFVLTRIKKANELNDDDFDYSSSKNINFIKNGNNSKNQECEMQIKYK